MPIDPITPGITSIPNFIQSVLNIIIKVGVPISAVFIIWAGFQFLTAQGDVTKLTAAKKSLVWAVVGMGVLLGSWLIATAIQGTISQIAGK